MKHIFFNCVSSSSSWVPQGNYLESNRDECTVSLIYAVHLKKQGSVSFEYQYPDNNLLFEFFVSRKHSFACVCLLVCLWMWVMRGTFTASRCFTVWIFRLFFMRLFGSAAAGWRLIFGSTLLFTLFALSATSKMCFRNFGGEPKEMLSSETE